jgi:nitrogen regulatory protein PII-like uncharacterized protein
MKLWQKWDSSNTWWSSDRSETAVTLATVVQCNCMAIWSYDRSETAVTLTTVVQCNCMAIWSYDRSETAVTLATVVQCNCMAIWSYDRSETAVARALIEWPLSLALVKVGLPDKHGIFTGLYKGKGKGKEIPLQASKRCEGSRRIRFPDFKTFGTWIW